MSYDNLTLAWNDYKEYLEETCTMTKEEMVKREEWFREAFKKSLGSVSKKTPSKGTKKGKRQCDERDEHLR